MFRQADSFLTPKSRVQAAHTAGMESCDWMGCPTSSTLWTIDVTAPLRSNLVFQGHFREQCRAAEQTCRVRLQTKTPRLHHTLAHPVYPPPPPPSFLGTFAGVARSSLCQQRCLCPRSTGYHAPDGQASYHSQRPGSTSGRRRDRVKRRARRAGRNAGGCTPLAAAALTRSFTQYRDAASQTFIEASSLTKVRRDAPSLHRLRLRQAPHPALAPHQGL